MLRRNHCEKTVVRRIEEGEGGMRVGGSEVEGRVFGQVGHQGLGCGKGGDVGLSLSHRLIDRLFVSLLSRE